MTENLIIQSVPESDSLIFEASDRHRSRSILPISSGEIVLNIISQLNSLFYEEQISFSEIEKQVIKICKNLIGAS